MVNDKRKAVSFDDYQGTCRPSFPNQAAQDCAPAKKRISAAPKIIKTAGAFPNTSKIPSAPQKRIKIPSAPPKGIKKKEQYDGTLTSHTCQRKILTSYVCSICLDSVRQAISSGGVLKCTTCQAIPYHRVCADKTPEWITTCPQCQQRSVQMWTGPAPQIS